MSKERKGSGYHPIFGVGREEEGYQGVEDGLGAQGVPSQTVVDSPGKGLVLRLEDAIFEGDRGL